MSQSLRTLRQRLFAVVEAALFVLSTALLALIALQVFTRYVLQASLPWTEEVARMVLVWMVMLGAAVAMERGEHYAITLISDRLRGTAKVAMLVATNILGVIFLVALAWYGGAYVVANMKTVYVSTQISRGWIYLAMPVGSAIMAFSLVSHSIEALSGGAAPASGTKLMDV